jgi:hypothetical protein
MPKRDDARKVAREGHYLEKGARRHRLDGIEVGDFFALGGN